jgi:hypothetical protein
MPTKTWVQGDDVLASDFNTYVQNQVVPTFANATARTAGIPAPVTGQLSVLLDTNHLEMWTGGVWVTLNDPPAIRVRATALQALTAAVETQIPMSTTDYVRNGMALVTNSINAPVAGLYQIIGWLGSANGAGNATLTGTITLTLLGNTYYARNQMTLNAAYASGIVTALVALTANERVGLYATSSVTAYADPAGGFNLGSTLSAALITK